MSPYLLVYVNVWGNGDSDPNLDILKLFNFPHFSDFLFKIMRNKNLLQEIENNNTTRVGGPN